MLGKGSAWIHLSATNIIIEYRRSNIYRIVHDDLAPQVGTFFDKF